MLPFTIYPDHFHADYTIGASVSLFPAGQNIECRSRRRPDKARWIPHGSILEERRAATDLEDGNIAGRISVDYLNDLKDDSFIARNTSLKLRTNLSTRLTSSTFVQWNNNEGEANMNFRIHYIPKIGSDIYIAYKQLWDEEDDMRTLYNAGIVKVDYLLRF